MKRQLHGVKSGFTLFELMVVIAIFGAFIVATNIFNYSPQTESEKADRMMVAISGRLKTELQNMSMGRMPKRNGEIAKTIRIDMSNSAMIMNYFTGSDITGTPFFSGSFRNPFFDGDIKYDIKSVTWSGSSTVGSFSWIGQIIIAPTDISFSGAGITGSGYTSVEIKVGYNSRSRKVILDRRTGKLIETKLY